MRIVYIVRASKPRPGPIEHPRILAHYASREAAELHAQRARDAASKLRQEYGDTCEDDSSPWDPEYVGFGAEPIYDVQEVLVLAHPDQWQDADRLERQPHLA